METEDKIDLKWGLFWGKVTLAFVTLIAGAIATKFFEDGTQTKLIIGAGLAAFTIATIGITFRKASYNPDEFERRIEILTLAQAGLWVIFYLIMMSAMSSLGWLAIETISIFIAPGAMMLYQVMISQIMRRKIALGKADSFLKFL